MPGFDRTGPYGEGPRTGRRMGKCHPRKEETEQQPGGLHNQQEKGYRMGLGKRLGRGWSWGRGLGRGPGRGMGRGPGLLNP
jgi:hypothetical protein